MNGIKVCRVAFPLALVLVIVKLSAAPQSQQPRPIEEEDERPQGAAALSITVDQVQLDVTVQDKRGNLIQGLTREHFKLYEDKVEQEILSLSPIEAPMTAVLLTEYSNAIPWEFLWEAWVASGTFLSGMRPGDWLAVVAYDLRPEILVDFTQNANEAMSALRRLNYPAFSESNLYDAVHDTLDRLQEVEGKVAVIVLSSGLDTFSKKNLNQILKRVKRSNVTIYAVQLGGNFRARADHRLPATVRMDLMQGEVTLKTFAKLTGGQAYFPRFPQAFRGVFQTISSLLRNQYSLSYASSNPAKDGYRKIRVQVSADIDGNGKADKLKVRHKEGYLHGPESQ